MANALSLALLSGCATPGSFAPVPGLGAERKFEFGQDTFAFPNELYWDYYYGPDGAWTTNPRVPKPDYAHRCFVVARSARQFFLNARFEPALPKANSEAYRDLVRQVVDSNPRVALPDDRKIVIPGYADLNSFSADYEALLKQECGPAWKSYVQRGHWRMIFPFTRNQQEKIADGLRSALASGQPLVLHVYRFPKLSINHALVAYAAREQGDDIEFTVYDPNYPQAPAKLFFRRNTRRFEMPPNTYFRGGPVTVYQVYHRWNY